MRLREKPIAASGGAGLNADDVPAAPDDEAKTDGRADATVLDSVPAENDVRFRRAVPVTAQPNN